MRRMTKENLEMRRQLDFSKKSQADSSKKTLAMTQSFHSMCLLTKSLIKDARTKKWKEVHEAGLLKHLQEGEVLADSEPPMD